MASPDSFTRTTLRVTPGDTSAYACIGQYGQQTTQPSKRGRFFIKLNVHDRDFRLSRATVTSRPNVGSYATREAALAAVPTARLVYEPPTRAPRPAPEPDDEEDLEVARARAFFRARPLIARRRSPPAGRDQHGPRRRRRRSWAPALAGFF